MGDIQIWGFSVDVVSAVLSIAVIVLPMLATLIVGALGVSELLPAFRKVVRSLREYVDQPTDSAVKFLADKLGVTEDQVIAALTKVIDEMGKEPTITPAPTPLWPANAEERTRLEQYIREYNTRQNQQEVYPPDAPNPAPALRDVVATMTVTDANGETAWSAQILPPTPDAPIEAVK